MVGVSYRNTIYLILIIFLLTIILLTAAYSNILNSPPVLDDIPTFILEKKIYIESFSSDELVALSTTEFGVKRWIPLLTLAFDCWRGNDILLNLHITNVVLHILCTLAVWIFFYQVLEYANKNKIYPCVDDISISPIVMSGCVAAIWSMNPVHTNSVTYIVQRMAVIQALFYITALAFYIKGRMAHNDGKFLLLGVACYSVTLICSICAFFSKENSVTLPVMLFLTELWFFQSNLLIDLIDRVRSLRWPSLVAVLIIFGLIVLFIAQIFSNIVAGYAIRRFTLLERLLTESRVILWYITLFIWPTPSRISLEYDVEISTSLFHPPTTIASVFVLVLILWWMFRFQKRQPVLSYAVLWFFMNILVESSFVPLELIFVHRLYLPSIGLAFILIVGCVSLIHKFNKRNATEREYVSLCWCIFAIYLSCLSLMTFTRNEAWQTRLSIYVDAVAKAPSSPRARANYASSLLDAGRSNEALQQAEIALMLGQEKYEEYFTAANVIFSSLMQQGKLLAAAERGEYLVHNHPPDIKMNSFPSLYIKLARAHLMLNHIPEAYSTAVAALDLIVRMKRSIYEGSKPPAEQLLCDIYQKAKEKGVDLGNGVAGELDCAGFKTRVAKLYLSFDDSADANRLLKEAVAENPQEFCAVELLADLDKNEALDNVQRDKWSLTARYSANPFTAYNASMLIGYGICESKNLSPLRDVGEYCIDYALKLKPDSVDAHLIKGWYNFQNDRANDAIVQAKRATELEPNNARAWLGLAFFLAKAGENAAAASAFETVLDLYPGYSKRGMVRQMIITLREETKAS